MRSQKQHNTTTPNTTLRHITQYYKIQHNTVTQNTTQQHKTQHSDTHAPLHDWKQYCNNIGQNETTVRLTLWKELPLKYARVQIFTLII